MLNDVHNLLGTSNDVNAAIKLAKDWVGDNPDKEVTFVGHSKGGAEAAYAAIATKNKNAIVFNPAPVSPGFYQMNASDYTGQLTSYVVSGEVLNNFFGEIGVGTTAYLPMQYINQRHPKIGNDINSFKNHKIKAVKSALYQHEGY